VYTFTSAANIFKVAQDAARYRRKKKAVVKAFPQPSKGNQQSDIIATSHVDIRTNATLGFMRVHKRARSWLEVFRSRRLQPAVVLRDEALVAKFEAHVKAFQEGKAAPEDSIKSIFGKSVVDGTF
jgi:hypothetical protein